MLPGEVLTAIRDHVAAQLGAPYREPGDAWHYSAYPAEVASVLDDAPVPSDQRSYSLAVAQISYPGLDGGGVARDAGSGRELYGQMSVQVMWRVAMTYDGDPHDDYAAALDDAHQLLAALLARPIGDRRPITIGLVSTRAQVSDTRYVEGVTEIAVHFPLKLSTGG